MYSSTVAMGAEEPEEDDYPVIDLTVGTGRARPSSPPL